MVLNQDQKKVQQATETYLKRVRELTDTYQQKVRAMLKAIDKERLERLKKDLVS